MTEDFFEEIHALKIIKEKRQVPDKTLTTNGRIVIERLLQSRLCIKKISGLWFWEKDVYEPTLDGLMLITRYDLLIRRIKHSIDIIARGLKDKTKEKLRGIVEKVLKDNGMNLLNFMVLELIVRSDVYDNYKIGEIQVQHMNAHFSEYTRNFLQQQEKVKKGLYNLSYLNSNSYYPTDHAYELLSWVLVLERYVDYQYIMQAETGVDSIQATDLEDTVPIEPDTVYTVSDSTSYDSGSSSSD